MLKKDIRIVGIVLSGGKSERMGQEKGLVHYRGKALIEYAIESLKPLCHELVISTAKDAYAYLNVPMLADEIPNCGPMGGISTCMSKRDADIYLVISCDMPHVPTQLFVDLLDKLNGMAIVPIDETGRKQPLAGCYTQAALPYFQQALKERDFKMMNLLDRLDTACYSFDSVRDYGHAQLFKNVNNMIDI